MNEDRFKKFILELSDLCKKHNITIAVEGYDRLEIYNYKNGDQFIDASDIVNKLDVSLLKR